MNAHVLKRFEAGVLHVSLKACDPQAELAENIIDHLTDIFRAVGTVEGARMVVLRGEGPIFCCDNKPADGSEIAQEPHENLIQKAKKVNGLLDAIHNCPLTAIVFCHGNVCSADIGLLAASDMAIAHENTRFYSSKAYPADYSSYINSRISQENYKHLSAISRVILAPEAKELRLVNFVGTEQDCIEYLESCIRDEK